METSPFVSSLLHFGHHSLLTHYKPHKYAEQEFSSCDSPNDADNNLWASSGEAASFQIDDLLDLPNEELVTSSPSTTAHAEGIPSSTMEISAERAGEDESAEHEPESGLCIPPDELVSQLEWLSGFNEDNFFSGDARYLSLSPDAKASPYDHPARPHEVPHEARDKFLSQSPVSVLEQNANSYALSHLHKPNRARKARTGGRVWSLEILKPISTGSRLKVRTGNTGLLAATCTSAYTEHIYMSFQREGMERPLKKAKKNGSSLCAMDSALVRRCSHCLVQKTPQWRAGPLGPKTLCNACGVRYKSGRLVPEYRPAASPTFVNEVHSNSHRRILEMRRVKEMETDAVFESNKHYVNGGLCPLGNGPNGALEACEENLRVTSHIEIRSPLYKQGNDPHLHDHQCKMHDDYELSSQGSSSSCKIEKAACRGGSTVMHCSKEAPEHDTISPRQPKSKEGLATIAGERVSLEEVQESQRHELVSLESCKAIIVESRKDQDTCKDGCDSAYAEEQEGCKWPGLHETA